MYFTKENDLLNKHLGNSFLRKTPENMRRIYVLRTPILTCRVCKRT